MLSILWFSLFAGADAASRPRTRCCSASARCSASAWAASGRRACRWCSSTGRRGCAASRRGCSRAATAGASSCRRCVFTYVYPMLEPYGDIAWRVMFWIGIAAGAAGAVDPRARCPRARSGWSAASTSTTHQEGGRGLAAADLPARPAGDHAAVVDPDRQLHVLVLLDLVLVRDVPARAGPRRRCRYLVALNLGGIAGAAAWGRISEGRPGRRGAATIAARRGDRDGAALRAHRRTRLLLTRRPADGVLRRRHVGRGADLPDRALPDRGRASAAASRTTPAPRSDRSRRSWSARCRTRLGAAERDGDLHRVALVICVAMLWLGPETRGRELVAVDGLGTSSIHAPKTDSLGAEAAHRSAAQISAELE